LSSLSESLSSSLPEPELLLPEPELLLPEPELLLPEPELLLPEPELPLPEESSFASACTGCNHALDMNKSKRVRRVSMSFRNLWPLAASQPAPPCLPRHCGLAGG
jgi:hypothetical protein